MTNLLLSALIPMIPTNNIVVRPHTNRPYHINLVWSVPPTNLTMGWVSTNGFGPYRYFETSNSITVSNLYWPNYYSFELRAYDRTNALMYGANTNPPASPVTFLWPWPLSNWVNIYLGSSTNPVAGEVNPPTPSLYRATYSVSTNSLTATVQVSRGNFKNWQSFPGLIVVTNSATNRFLRIAVTNNMDGTMKPD